MILTGGIGPVHIKPYPTDHIGHRHNHATLDVDKIFVPSTDCITFTKQFKRLSDLIDYPAWGHMILEENEEREQRGQTDSWQNAAVSTLTYKDGLHKFSIVRDEHEPQLQYTGNIPIAAKIDFQAQFEAIKRGNTWAQIYVGRDKSVGRVRCSVGGQMRTNVNVSGIAVLHPGDTIRLRIEDQMHKGSFLPIWCLTRLVASVYAIGPAPSSEETTQST